MTQKTAFIMPAVIAGALFSATTFASPITGTYVGQYQLTMNAHDGAGFGGMPLNSIFKGELNGQQYNILGRTFKHGIWVWDFDNQQVTIGGGILRTFIGLHVPFQAFNLAETENKRPDQSVLITDKTEVTMPFTYDEARELYRVEYAHKKYLQLQMPPAIDVNYPIGETQTYFNIIPNQDGSLSITTADIEVGIDPDNVPGTRIEDVFPATVQVEYQSSQMVADDLTDTNQDGISDQLAKLLLLDPTLSDIDGDGLSDAIEAPTIVRATDSDHDGVADLFEPGASATDAKELAGVPLGGHRRVTIRSKDEIDMLETHYSPYQAPESLGLTLQSEPIPQTTADGKPLSWDLGEVTFNLDPQTSMMMTEYQFELTFDQLPEDLTIYRKQIKIDVMAEKEVVSYEPLEYQVNQTGQLELTMNAKALDEYFSVGLVFGTTEDFSPTEPTAPETPSDNGSGKNQETPAALSSSGGSLGWLALTFLGWLGFRRTHGKV